MVKTAEMVVHDKTVFLPPVYVDRMNYSNFFVSVLSSPMLPQDSPVVQ